MRGGDEHEGRGFLLVTTSDSLCMFLCAGCQCREASDHGCESSDNKMALC